MRTDSFDFELPRDRIAARPVRPRDAARLLLVGESGFADHRVRDLPELLRPSDLVVFNDTRVIPARLVGRRGTARVELTLHRRDPEGRWRAFAKPARKLKTGERIELGPDFAAAVEAKGRDGEVILRFAEGDAALRLKLMRHGTMPLPPYIGREPEAGDADDYQTVYARHEGSVAAPTAGLHFTPELLARLGACGIERVFVTLHVGAGTFLPVKTEEVENHRMLAEAGRIDGSAAAAVNEAKACGRRILAVGTTTLRLLEAAAGEDGRLRPFEGEIALFIRPGYRFRVVDLLLTNFHLPRSTLFILVAAFSGLERMKAAYAHAVRAGYRFYSYGDCTLLERAGESA